MLPAAPEIAEGGYKQLEFDVRSVGTVLLEIPPCSAFHESRYAALLWMAYLGKSKSRPGRPFHLPSARARRAAGRGWASDFGPRSRLSGALSLNAESWSRLQL